MKLIDGNKLISKFAERKEIWRETGVLPSDGSLVWLAAMDITSNAPTIDAEPVKHGHWIHMKNGNAECSVCGRRVVGVYDDDNADKFCRHCGARMNLEE